MKIRFEVNGTLQTLEADPDMPLLWALRDLLGLKGTKFGCGRSQCGACTVHVDGEPMLSCVLKIGQLGRRAVTTIEGLSPDGEHPLQVAWREHNVPQCGYCQSGQIMSAAVLLAGNADPSDDEIDQAMTGNLCRCGTYPRIRAAIQAAGRKS
jgi:isoquinoline 1-oxidoreductase alpha subunit